MSSRLADKASAIVRLAREEGHVHLRLTEYGDEKDFSYGQVLAFNDEFDGQIVLDTTHEDRYIDVEHVVDYYATRGY